MKKNKPFAPSIRGDTQLISSLGIFLRTSVFVLVMVVLSKIMTYLYRIIVARSFDAETYGLFSLALMAASIAVTIALLGLDNGLNRYVPFYRGKNNPKAIRFIFRFIFFVTGLLGCILGIVLFFTADYVSNNLFHSSSLVGFIRVFAIGVPVWVTATILLSVLKSYEKISLYSFLFNFVQNLAKIAILFLLILLGFGSIAVIYSYVLALTLLCIILLLIMYKKFRYLFSTSTLPKPRKKKLLVELWGYSLPLLFLGVLGSIFYWVDSFMLGYYKGPISVGLYNIAIPISSLLLMCSELFMQLFLPLVTREYARGKIELVKNISKQISKWIFMINIPLFILIIVFPGVIINVLFGSDYLGAVSALRFLVIGALVTSFLTISNQLIYMVGKSRILLGSILFAALMNVILNSLLIPLPTIFGVDNSNGISGAALGTTISVFLLYLALTVESYLYTGIVPIRRKMVNIALSSIIPLLVLLKLHGHAQNLFSMIVLATFFGVLYLANLILFKSFDKNDLHLIRGFGKKLNIKSIMNLPLIKFITRINTQPRD